MKYRLVIEMDAQEAEAYLENDYTTVEIERDGRDLCLACVLRDYGSGVRDPNTGAPITLVSQ